MVDLTFTLTPINKYCSCYKDTKKTTNAIHFNTFLILPKLQQATHNNQFFDFRFIYHGFFRKIGNYLPISNKKIIFVSEELGTYRY